MPRPPLASSYDFARTAGCYTGDGDQPPITDEDRGRFVVVTIGLHVEATAVSALHAAPHCQAVLRHPGAARPSRFVTACQTRGWVRR